MAYHEAGHAVAAVLLGHPITSVSVIIGEGTLGGMKPSAEDLQGDDVACLRRVILICIAGVISEVLRYGSAVGFGAGLYGPGQPIEEDGSDLGEIKRLNRLIRERTGTNVQLEKSLEKTQRLLTKNWTAVDTVAKALIKEKHLTGDQVIAVIGYRRSRRAVENDGLLGLQQWVRRNEANFRRLAGMPPV
jgi:ATP-dependent Zn protease